MRIAILADPLDNQQAGVHVFTSEMVKAMIRTNTGHELILIREKTDVALKGVTQVPVWNTRLPLGFASLRLFFIVPFLLRKKKADVVIEPAHFGPFNLPKRTKRVTIIHDLTPILFPNLHRWHSQVLQGIFLKGILNKTDLIVANSDHTAADVCNVYPQNCRKVKRIYPGKSARFRPENKSGALEKYQIRKPYFLFVGTIEPRKNLLVLLEAFRLFRHQAKSSVTLVIAGGNGWKSESFFEALRNHPDKDLIRCTGYVDAEDLPTLYTQALAMIYPSTYEGFGLPVLEAMSCGTPVISADNSSLPEAGGNIARYFKADDPAALARLMSDTAADLELRNKLSEQMSAHVKKFDWDEFGREMYKAIEALKK